MTAKKKSASDLKEKIVSRFLPSVENSVRSLAESLAEWLENDSDARRIYDAIVGFNEHADNEKVRCSSRFCDLFSADEELWNDAIGIFHADDRMIPAFFMVVRFMEDLDWKSEENGIYLGRIVRNSIKTYKDGSPSEIIGRIHFKLFDKMIPSSNEVRKCMVLAMPREELSCETVPLDWKTVADIVEGVLGRQNDFDAFLSAIYDENRKKTSFLVFPFKTDCENG